MASDEQARDLTEDAVLGGRLRLRQPARGHRVGHDAILLAAATPALAGEHVVDLGAGVGAAGLAVAARVPGVSVTLIERDAGLVALAAENAVRSGFSARALTLDVTAPAAEFAAAGLPPQSAARVLMNPPFNDSMRHRGSPDPQRRAAHVAPPDLLDRWVETAARLLRPDGTLTLIWRPEGLADVLRALAAGFGGIAILPLHGKPQEPAIRILVRAARASQAPFALLPALVLNDAAGRPTAEAEAVLRSAAALPLGKA
jgi:tRNA1(Val) A37 N6-methylase TrmN6